MKQTTTRTTSKETIIGRLRGTTLHIPNLRYPLRRWPGPRRNALYEDMSMLVRGVLRDAAIVVPATKTQSVCDDFALMACLWYPQALRAQLETLVRVLVWVFFWDDGFEGDGPLAADLDGAERRRKSTRNVIRATLGLGNLAPDDEVDSLNGLLFGCREQFAGMSRPYRERLYRNIDDFISSCAAEQHVRLAGIVPDFKGYMKVRVGTTGGTILCALLEYAMQTELAAEFIDSDHRRGVEKSVEIMIAYINDIVSVKKELDEGAGWTPNVLYSLMAGGMTAEEAVGWVSREMGHEPLLLDLRALLLRVEVSRREARRRESVWKATDAEQSCQRYIDGCRAIIVGWLEFGLLSSRYGMPEFLCEDGSLDVVL
ncbi:hypothetical protein DCS_01132 [Drechmeria coniospora]|uniref:Uncharacterized protein n=1 Tax=Drechmeria coniospora TaxID=98403 RepID=A0A151GSE5_DRECN|nr:hypothetical protein DCS_01132 [Drechmeria coniospora]KYK59998.1 hypothetical protein DCS_01132 [Drechmeria coniospora]